MSESSWSSMVQAGGGMSRYIPANFIGIVRLLILLMGGIGLQGFTDNTEIGGTVFSSFIGFSATQCARACNQNDRCYGWNYRKLRVHSGRCDLLHPVSGVSQSSQCCASDYKQQDFISGEHVLLQGQDLVSLDFFTLQETRPDLCWAACVSNASCRAWSYVGPHETYGRDPYCSLYRNSDVVVSKITCDYCLSGFKGFTGELSFDDVKDVSMNVHVRRTLPGYDYVRVPFIGKPEDPPGDPKRTGQDKVFPRNGPEQCWAFCNNDRNCDAWTWAESEHIDLKDPNSPLTQVCHLKDYGCLDDSFFPHGIGKRFCSPSTRRRFVPIFAAPLDRCCISGVRSAAKIDSVSVSRSLPAAVGPAWAPTCGYIVFRPFRFRILNQCRMRTVAPAVLAL